MNLVLSPSKLDDKNKHVAKLVALENTTITNIQLKAGEEIPEHDSKNEVVVAVRKGIVKFLVEGHEVHVTQENLLHLAPYEKHSLRAVEDADILVMQIKP
ncbi:hypothetical protein FITA111629_12450 [Filibacter tadaridae]|uniref:AraC-type arabinose-binding/dimerisation domain-containing protein n=1 Tax=Filibacter tadaridae TaxID=2483811 RepID=A0A3P5WV02_9BACL|nr:hypothetical protein [Filibacter tadaridae]VDC25508.1 hypothetical protein FILTAD_01214 [Filibacter tadaridae]